MTQGISPVSVPGPRGYPILIIREYPGVTPGIITGNDGHIIRIIVPYYSGTIPTTITGPNGQLIYLIPGEHDTTPGAVTNREGEILYIILPEEFSHITSTPGLIGPDIGLINPGYNSTPSSQTGPSAQTGTPFSLDFGFPDYDGKETNGTKGTGVGVTGGYDQFGPIPLNYTPQEQFVFGPDFQPEIRIPRNYSLSPQIEFELFGNPEYNNTNPLLTLRQFDNIFSIILKNGSPRIRQIALAILKARGHQPASFDLRVFVTEMSYIFTEMRNGNNYFNYSELFIELMFELIMAALEIIRNVASFCIQEVTIYSPPQVYVSNYINSFFDILLGGINPEGYQKPGRYPGLNIPGTNNFPPSSQTGYSAQNGNPSDFGYPNHNRNNRMLNRTGQFPNYNRNTRMMNRGEHFPNYNENNRMSNRTDQFSNYNGNNRMLNRTDPFPNYNRRNRNLTRTDQFNNNGSNNMLNRTNRFSNYNGNNRMLNRGEHFPNYNENNRMSNRTDQHSNYNGNNRMLNRGEHFPNYNENNRMSNRTDQHSNYNGNNRMSNRTNQFPNYNKHNRMSNRTGQFPNYNGHDKTEIKNGK
ncbi:uncharacterized protein CDAR_194581 [Caerostris darwini]|uniref:Capsid protein n=1 Tax=Caerostris darwini TaxID=1538125 RepID=A0AAV4X7G3_9ARAC|nr:uncharacterized protein CDAR_194581 [Caerostris darwini]